MEMTRTEQDGVTRVALSGSLDYQGTTELDQKLQDVATASDRVILDLSGLDYLSSIGIRSLLSAAKAMGARGGRMVILNPNDLVRTVLVHTGVDSIIPITSDEQEATQRVQE